jgi:hypothetical protein
VSSLQCYWRVYILVWKLSSRSPPPSWCNLTPHAPLCSCFSAFCIYSIWFSFHVLPSLLFLPFFTFPQESISQCCTWACSSSAVLCVCSPPPPTPCKWTDHMLCMTFVLDCKIIFFRRRGYDEWRYLSESQVPRNFSPEPVVLDNCWDLIPRRNWVGIDSFEELG